MSNGIIENVVKLAMLSRTIKKCIPPHFPLPIYYICIDNPLKFNLIFQIIFNDVATVYESHLVTLTSRIHLQLVLHLKDQLNTSYSNNIFIFLLWFNEGLSRKGDTICIMMYEQTVVFVSSIGKVLWW